MTADVASLISDNLDVWTTAVERKSSAGRGGSKRVNFYGIDRLRALILDLALHGRLVRQDPAEGEASKLLPLIDDERRKRIRAGEMKSPKVGLNFSRVPYEVPTTWIWIPLGATGNIFTGNSINAHVRAKLESNPNGLPFVATKDIGYGLDPIDYDNGLTVPHGDDSFNAARAGTVFICAEGGSAGKKIAISDREICFGNKLIANETWSAVDPKFVLYFYLSDFFFSEFSKDMTGIIGGISRAKFLALAFPLPPFAEQQRIVAKVDELMALCDALETESTAAMAVHQGMVEALLATLSESSDESDLGTNWARIEAHFDTLFTTESSVDALKQTILGLAVRGKLVPQVCDEEPASVLLRAVKESGSDRGTKQKFHPNVPAADQPFDLPDGWCWERFDNLIDPAFPIAYGVLVPGADQPDGVPFVRIADLSITDPSPLPEKAISPEVEAQFLRTRLVGGEILMGVVGSIGKLGVAPASWAGANIARAICRIVPSPLLDSAYVLWLLQSRFMQDSFSGDTRTLAQPTLNIGLIRLAATPVPPAAEQQRIVAKINELMAVCEALQLGIGIAAKAQKYLADTIVELAAA